MKFIIELILRVTKFRRVGSRIKYRLKTFDKYKFKETGWVIKLYSTNKTVLKKKWNLLDTLGWFTYSIDEIEGIADPFLTVYNKKLYVFFEAEIINKRGEIWCSEIINNKIKKPFPIIRNSFHMSFPYVFQHNNKVYMLPESSEDYSVRLYESIDFPNKWKLIKKVFVGKPLADTNFFLKEGVFYWFTFDFTINKTRLYYSFEIDGKWNEHNKSPFISNRNAGNIFVLDNRIYRPIQINVDNYGEGVALNEILNISVTDFEEVELQSPFLYKNKGFDLDGVHHFSFTEFESNVYIITDGLNNNYYKLT